MTVFKCAFPTRMNRLSLCFSTTSVKMTFSDSFLWTNQAPIFQSIQCWRLHRTSASLVHSTNVLLVGSTAVAPPSQPLSFLLFLGKEYGRSPSSWQRSVCVCVSHCSDRHRYVDKILWFYFESSWQKCWDSFVFSLTSCQIGTMTSGWLLQPLKNAQQLFLISTTEPSKQEQMIRPFHEDSGRICSISPSF